MTILDSGLAAHGDFILPEVFDQYQVPSTSYGNLAFEGSMFEGIDASVKLNQSWKLKLNFI
jgi:hypothetical protein